MIKKEINMFNTLSLIKKESYNGELFSGRFSTLSNVISIEGIERIYLVKGDSDMPYTIDLGRNRKLVVPEDSKLVIHYDARDFIIAKLPINAENYLHLGELAKKSGLAYSIPKKLSETSSRYYSKLEYAIDDVYCVSNYGFWGKNGCAFVHSNTVGCNVYRDTTIDVSKGNTCFAIDDKYFTGIYCPDSPNMNSKGWKEFIYAILMTDYHIRSGEKLVELFKSIGFNERYITDIELYG